MPWSAVGPKGPKCRCEQVTSLRLRGYGETSDRKRRVENAPDVALPTASCAGVRMVTVSVSMKSCDGIRKAVLVRGLGLMKLQITKTLPVFIQLGNPRVPY